MARSGRAGRGEAWLGRARFLPSCENRGGRIED
jgi:hypothetical protein